MARPQKNNVEYFPHYLSRGKKMTYIELKYKNDGYAVWFKILEQLADTDYHYINLNDPIEKAFLVSRCLISENMLFDILEDLALLGEINKNLWSKKIVWSKKFMDSIADAYKRRETKTFQFTDLCRHIEENTTLKLEFMHTETILLHTETPQQSSNMYELTPESKVKETILKGEGDIISEIPPIKKDFEKLSIDDLCKYFLSESNQSWREYQAMQTDGFDLRSIEKSIEMFCVNLKKEIGLDGSKTIADFRSHFSRWLKYQNPESVNVVSQEMNLEDPSTPPDNSGIWFFHNGKWRDTSKMTAYQKRQLNIS